MTSLRDSASNILGLSVFYQDSAAALLCDGTLAAAAQEERFSRKKHDAEFPEKAIEYCLVEVGIGLTDIGLIVFYDKPYVKYERLLETYLSYAPKGLRSFGMAIVGPEKESILILLHISE